MATGFEVQFCLSESCDGITFKDITGFFGTSNPYGYNAPAPSVPTLAIDGTFGYTSYTLSIWASEAGGIDMVDGVPTSPALITVDLLTATHTIDPVTGYVTWAFTFEDLGLSGPNVRSGWWFIRLDPVLWTNDSINYDYSTDQQFGFTGDVTRLMDNAKYEALRKKGWNCGDCKCGGTPIGLINQRYLIIRDLAGCVGLDDEFTKGIDYLYSILPLCGC